MSSVYKTVIGYQPMVLAGDAAEEKSFLPTRADLTDFKKPWPYVGMGTFAVLLGGALYLDLHKKKRK